MCEVKGAWLKSMCLQDPKLNERGKKSCRITHLHYVLLVTCPMAIYFPWRHGLEGRPYINLDSSILYFSHSGFLVFLETSSTILLQGLCTYSSTFFLESSSPKYPRLALTLPLGLCSNVCSTGLSITIVSMWPATPPLPVTLVLLSLWHHMQYTVLLPCLKCELLVKRDFSRCYLNECLNIENTDKHDHNKMSLDEYSMCTVDLCLLNIFLPFSFGRKLPYFWSICIIARTPLHLLLWDRQSVICLPRLTNQTLTGVFLENAMNAHCICWDH